jgi:peroxiredoxin
MMMRLKMVMTAVTAASVSLFALAGAMPPPQGAPGTAVPAMQPKVAEVGKAAPMFSLKDSNGKEVNLADYKGKVIVLEWMNFDCPIDTRVVESKLISTVHDKFKDQVVWLGIDSTSTHTKADYDKMIAAWKISYPVLNDAAGKVGHLYNAKTTPHMYIIDKDGTLVYAGGIDDDPQGTKAKKLNYVDKALGELLAGKTIEIKESAPYGCAVKYAN